MKYFSTSETHFESFTCMLNWIYYCLYLLNTCIFLSTFKLGMTKQQAEMKLLSDAFQLENWGVSYLKVINMEDNSPAYIGIGGFHIRLCNAQWKMVRK